MAAVQPPVAARGIARRGSSERWREVGFQALVLSALLLALLVLAVLLFDILTAAVPVFRERGLSFLGDPLSTRPGRTGLLQPLIGSLQIAVVTVLVAFPLGIATAVYLEEYASDTRTTRFIDVNIRNLAGVPSIVYGLLGFAIFVRFLGQPELGGVVSWTGGRTALAAGLTLAVLVLPIVTITAAEAVRAVPTSLRHGGYGLGATRWEVTRQLVVPHAAPGMLTGMILSLSRAIGETAPLLVVGAASFLVGTAPNPLASLREPFTALPMTVFTWSKRPQAAFTDELAPAAILVLLLFTLALNGVAIWLRNRYEKQLER